jgi:hypothetical protein
VLVEGACDHGQAVGAWFTWSWGQLVDAVAITRGMPVGLHLFQRGGAYDDHVERSDERGIK